MSNPDSIIPIFTISRIEIENKGYPQLLDALVLQDHLLKHRLVGQRHAEDTRVVCFLIAAHGPKPKDKLPGGVSRSICQWRCLLERRSG